MGVLAPHDSKCADPVSCPPIDMSGIVCISPQPRKSGCPDSGGVVKGWGRCQIICKGRYLFILVTQGHMQNFGTRGQPLL